jgi:Zn-dependent M28 family amino/carboxypeptidase
MPQVRRFVLCLLCVTAGVLAAASAAAAATSSGSSTCDQRVNNVPSKLIPCIRTGDLWSYMQKFQRIANANPGADGHPSRNSGEPGYKASVDYVAELMKEWGYNVRIQTYHFDYFSFLGLPTFSEVSPSVRNFALVNEWNPAHSMGTANAEVQPAGGIIIPPTSSPTSQSGCTSADFNGFVSGRIALIQRGGCNFGVKVQNAQAAGASGVIIFNEGNPGRTSVFSGTLLDANNNPFVAQIPVAFTSFFVGQDLYNAYQKVPSGGTPPAAKLSISAIEKPNAPDYNVIANSKQGDPNNAVVVDAHLDAIYGAGMLDNGSGSATILDIARMMRKVQPFHQLRFIWFGGEELGLIGSKYYVNNLTPTQLSHIGYDLDADVTATPNYVIGILDPAAKDFFGRTVSTKFPDNVYAPSKVSRNQSIDYFNSIGKNHELFSPVGTDAFSFNVAGIPASGVLTGQDCCKNQHEVDLFGGSIGNYEGNLGTADGGCVDNPFRWCDNISNNDPSVLTFMSKAFANTVVRMAYDTSVIGTSVRQARQAKAGLKPAAASGGGKFAIK